MQIASSPILIEERSGISHDIKRGSSVKHNFYVKNTSGQKVEVDLWISATDSKSEALLRWCTFSEKNPLVIDANDFKEVTLNFQVPTSAKPDLYNYEVLIESASQYPGKIFRRSQHIRVLPSDRESQWVNEPKFNIYPPTSSTNPKILKAGEKLEVKVRVENRSRRVDRFYISSELTPEFSAAWYTIKYPESELDIPGLVKETDGLELNPGKEGEITLILHPPKYTFAGNYCPTIRLISSNREDLVLLDILYLRILSDDRLDVEMSPNSRKVPLEEGEFEIELTNQGNIKRELKLDIKDKKGIFNYSLRPSIVKILPGVTETVVLKTEPKKWLRWRRHLRGKGLEFTFDVDVNNTKKFLLPETKEELAIPQSLPQGKILWQSRSWWVLWLLVLLALLGVGGIIVIIWWDVLQSKIPQVPPKVEKFETKDKKYEKQQKVYQQGEYTEIPLYWEISDSEKIDKITLILLESNVERNRINYFLSDKISQDKEKKGFALEFGDCNFIGDSSQAQSAKKNRSNQNNPLSLENFLNIPMPFMDTNNDDDINTLSCDFSGQMPQKAGKYNYKLEVFSKQNSERPSSSQITDTITINPPPPLPLPNILKLSSSQSVYEEIDANLSTAKQSSVKKSSDDIAIAPIKLNWEIGIPENIQELRLVGKTPDGLLNSAEKIYKFTDGNLPTELQTFCQFQTILNEAQKLKCSDIPIYDANKAGEYIFTLTVIPTAEATPRDDKDKSVISKQTPKIKIQPPPPKPATPVEISSFKINGREVKNRPKQTFVLNKQRLSANIAVSWQVKDGEDIKVEILPAPGVVSTQGSISRYPLSRPPSSEVIKLRVTNKAGEEKIQSVVIETIESNSLNRSQPFTPGNNSGGSNSGVSNGASNSGTSDTSIPGDRTNLSPPDSLPVESNGLPPIELPPQAN